MNCLLFLRLWRLVAETKCDGKNLEAEQLPPMPESNKSPTN